MLSILSNQQRLFNSAANLMRSFGGKLQSARSQSWTGRKKNLGKKDKDKMLGRKPLKQIDSNVMGNTLNDIGALLPKGKKYTVSVEGNIGCGKTTLLEYFRSSPNVEAIREPVEQWTNIQGHNALALLYEDPQRWSFTFNLYAQLTRIQMHVKPHMKPVKMLERSLYSTRYCFVENDFRNKTINGMELGILNGWFDFLMERENTSLDLIIYLRADPQVCFNRIKKRSRKEECCVPFELIQSLHDLHEEWLIQHKKFKLPAPVLVLDANKEYSEITQLYEDKRQEILCGFH
ncbi:thymidine kinase 2, mitochondrial-like [Mytilus edulis]|uniref:thymidine kinase 2, mitochondrial-like n=1 Tax=Mytilus edulis TaxID=6550 RepID=UPI0039F13B76